MPQINPQVICRQIGFTVTVDGDGVDMVSVCVGKHSSGAGFNHQVHGFKYWYLKMTTESRIILVKTILLYR